MNQKMEVMKILCKLLPKDVVYTILVFLPMPRPKLVRSSKIIKLKHNRKEKYYMRYKIH